MKRVFSTYVTGITHHKKNFYSLDLDKEDFTLDLVEEPTNKYDPDAIKVIVDGKHIGYIPAKKCKKVKKILHTKNVIETRYVHEEEEIDDLNVDYRNLIYIWYK